MRYNTQYIWSDIDNVIEFFRLQYIAYVENGTMPDVDDETWKRYIDHFRWADVENHFGIHMNIWYAHPSSIYEDPQKFWAEVLTVLGVLEDVDTTEPTSHSSEPSV